MTTAALAQAPLRRPGFFKNLLYWIMDWDDEYTLREGVRRLHRGRSGFLDSLSPEALEFIRGYDGPEVPGPPLTRRERSHVGQGLAVQA
jgi:hypothetical protein